jgi:positive regulator of sigma E activity
MSDKNVKGRIQNISDSTFTVSLDSEESCSTCGLSGVCSDKKIEFEKEQVPFNIKVGQSVEVEYQKVIQTSLIVYMIPIFCFFAGIALISLAIKNPSEPLQFLGAIIGTGIGLMIVSLLNKRLADNKFKVNIKPINI